MSKPVAPEQNALDIQADTAAVPPRAGRGLATALLDPAATTAAVLAGLHREQPAMRRDGTMTRGVDSGAMQDALEVQIEALATNPTEAITRHLAASAALLNGVAVSLTARAMDSTGDEMERLLSLALKAQNQYQKTLVVLHSVRTPKRAVFIRQQNQAGIQQVNNTNSQIVGNLEYLQSLGTTELLQVLNHAKTVLESRAAHGAIGTDSHMEALGAFDGSTD